jgi:acid phosphatase type 7
MGSSCEQGDGPVGELPPADRQPDHVPDTLHLTWCGDPARSMNVQWLHEPGMSGATDAPVLAYRERATEQWRLVHGKLEAYPVVSPLTHLQYGVSPRIVRAAITDLYPDTEYEFRIQPDGALRQFRTAPATLDRPLHFAVGGDIHITEAAQRNYQQLAAAEPLFAAIGGDLAYDDGANTDISIEWLQQWSRGMVTADGRLIPALAAVGNHEVRGGYVDPALPYAEMGERAPFFLSLFGCQFAERSYAAVDFGKYLTLFLLDTNHLSPVTGAQAEWLEQALAARHVVRFRVPLYHVAAYPSFRPPEDRVAAAIRRHWVPLFEQYGVRIAFENHDHTYKRTWPLRASQRDESAGVTYAGDGAWGAFLRTPATPEERDYLRVSAAVHHVLLVEIRDDGRMQVRAVSDSGEEIDAFEIRH